VVVVVFENCRWLRQPLMDIDEINVRHDVVELLTNNTVGRDKLRDGPLKNMPDLESISNR
jgi:DNA mismatch repair ATPase MutS